MGCASCGSGTPNGCKNNGACGSGGCNKLEVFDWLANIQLPAGQSPYDILEVRFKNSRKAFYRNTKSLSLQAGDVVVVEGSPGLDVGVVSVTGELARIQVDKKAPGFKPMEAKKVKRIADQEDIDRWISARSLEREVMYKSRTLAVNLGLEMKISDVEYQADLTKATFYYTAEGRVDFRQLIRDMAEEFKIRIEMRQIGSRQEASRLGGIGSCGRELCCATWLSDFRSVSTSAARYQQLSLNPQKLAGQCGKLKCCLNYELDMYLDALKAFPKGDLRLKTEKGNATYIKTDVFRKQMWYAFDGETGAGSGLVPLSPERVREIIKLNKAGKLPADLRDFIEEEEVVEPDYTNVVGQDSLNRFEHLFTKKKKRKKKGSGQKPNDAAATSQKAPNPKAPNREKSAQDRLKQDKPKQVRQEGSAPEGKSQEGGKRRNRNKNRRGKKPEGGSPNQNNDAKN